MGQNIKAGYPINLYLPKSWVLVFFGMGGFCIWLGRLETLVESELIVRIFAFLTVSIGMVFIAAGLIALLNTAPHLTIRNTGFNHFILFKKGKRAHYYWKDIKSMSLESQVLKHHKTWYISLRTKQDTLIDIGLRPMKYESVMLNEKEIYELMLQSFEGRRSSTIHAISMSIEDRFQL